MPGSSRKVLWQWLILVIVIVAGGMVTLFSQTSPSAQVMKAQTTTGRVTQIVTQMGSFNGSSTQNIDSDSTVDTQNIIRQDLGQFEGARIKTPGDEPRNFTVWYGQTIFYHPNERPPYSRVQCLSENFRQDAYLYRSCRFANLCLDLKTREFVLHPSKTHSHLESLVQNHSHLSSVPGRVISGGQHAYWLKRKRGLWIPQSRQSTELTSFYTLDDDTVWISYFPLSACNAGHVLWDTFLSIFTLLEIFEWLDKKLFLTEMPGSPKHCYVVGEYARLMGINYTILPVTQLRVPSFAPAEMICVRHFASGMGWLTDHGLTEHGRYGSDFANQRNVGRGPNLARFRSYALKNLGKPTRSTLTRPYNVVFSILSSQDKRRRSDFAKQIQMARTYLNETLATVQVVALWNFTLEQQIDIATKTAVFISMAGGGTSSAFFLPKGASLILYDSAKEKLDFDLWNNFGHVRVHWLSKTTMNQDTDLLLSLICDELESLDSFVVHR